jgi:hypothetical protein
MSSRREIRAALETTLAGIGGLPSDIQWENVTFDTPDDTPYLRTSVQFVTREPATIGFTHTVESAGIFLVDVFCPENSGPRTADDYADIITAAFEAGTQMTSGSVTVRTNFVKAGPGMPDGLYYMVPVTVSWYCHHAKE